MLSTECQINLTSELECLTKSRRLLHGILLNARINNSFNSKLTMRTKIQYSDFSNSWFIEPMITYQPNAFSALYFGVNDLLQTEDNIISSLTKAKDKYLLNFNTYSKENIKYEKTSNHLFDINNVWLRIFVDRKQVDSKRRK
ncbi:MAG: hypothetical protein CM15mP127_13390 [Gammaproteobacteria bacterium]|nr:MAG: hypothetical protein CM15mP127_13390 [Gammaproteobacteria bacterium]